MAEKRWNSVVVVMGGKFVVGLGKRGGNAGRNLGPARPAFVLIVHPSHQMPSSLRLASLLFFFVPGLAFSRAPTEKLPRCRRSSALAQLLLRLRQLFFLAYLPMPPASTPAASLWSCAGH
jgi:hypothetical protein